MFFMYKIVRQVRILMNAQDFANAGIRNQLNFPQLSITQIYILISLQLIFRERKKEREKRRINVKLFYNIFPNRDLDLQKT